MVAIYASAAYGSFRVGVGIYALVSAFILVGTILDGQALGDMVWVVSIITGVWAAGRGVHLRQQRVVELGRGHRRRAWRDGSGMSTGGHGLTGMRERVNMLGGQIDVGPLDSGGFALRAPGRPPPS